MSSVRLEVLWSPVHKNKFITWGTEILLYETRDKVEGELGPENVDISETTSARLLATNSNYHYVKCVDVYPVENTEVLLAIGQANGKIALTTFGPSNFDYMGLNGLELMPKHARQCNSAVWNPKDPQLIAAGFDRYRSDHCVLVWDIRSRQAATVYAELGLSDTAHSLAWLIDQPQTLVVGMNNKHLKLVDVRDPSKAANSSQTKAVYGVTVAPFSTSMLASYVESQIAIWDTRSFEKPVVSLQQGKPVTKILWCPTRNHLLGSLQRDSKSIHLHYLQQMDEMEPTVLERSFRPGSSSQITSFSWHPENENRLLTITLAGGLTDSIVSERMTLNWAQSSDVVWTYGQKTLKTISCADPVYAYLGDNSCSMKKKALEGYGLQAELKENARFVDEPDLKGIWDWLDHSERLTEQGIVSGTDTKHPGIRVVLGMEKMTPGWLITKSEASYASYAGFTNTIRAKVYRSTIRDKALNLCKWNFIHDPIALHLTVQTLLHEGQVTRAAAVSVFGLELKLAIKLLSENKLNTVSMALSGFTDNKDSVWRESCMASRTELDDPYLRAIFAFLTSENENYDLVLNEDISVDAKVGFALTFLSDPRLLDFINQLTEQLTSEGNLAGIVLTGLGPRALPLLQEYIDLTGDVQSVSVIAMRAFSTDLLENERVQYWINSYRELLDIWRLWNQRAKFDIQHNARTATRPEQQIYVMCNYCQKGLSTNALYARNRGPFQRAKISSCPHCRKPQPRCAICLLNMGTPSSFQPDVPSITNGHKMNPIESWYTWCQTCRHGGHAGHITHWFKIHSECPVTGCTCRCLSLDATSELPSA